jgi:hypothetical protein
MGRSAKPTTHVAANGNMASGGFATSIVRKETDNVLDDTDRFTDLAGDAMDLLIADVPIPLLHVLEHFDNPRSNLPIH